MLVSDRAGAVETFVPESPMATGKRFDPYDVPAMAIALRQMAGLPDEARRVLGRKAASIAMQWGPERFAQGAIEAFQIAFMHQMARIDRPMSLAS